MNPTEYHKSKALDAVCYEIEQLAWSTSIDVSPLTARHKNAILESRLIHMRNLDEFFSYRPYKDYVRSSYYEFETGRVLENTIRERLNEDLAHLSFARVTRSKMQWTSQLAINILTRCLSFAEHVLSNGLTGERIRWEQLAVDLRQIANLPASFATVSASTSSVQITIKEG